jgi:hypothetical protein
MIKRKIILVLVLAIQFPASAQLDKLFKKVTNSSSLSQVQIENGLKEALDNGIQNQVSKLTAVDGFYKNDLVKILLPKELRAVDKGLRRIGMGSQADEGIKILNRAAEDAVKTATPIFIDAVKNMSIDDAKKILLGNENAATAYLETTTTESLHESFTPVIKNSFSKVGADKVWSALISKYNGLPFVSKVNPDLTDYVTNESLKGVFKMIEIEEKGIRQKSGLRNTDLLKQVFALQD